MSGSPKKILLREIATGKFLSKDLAWIASSNEAKLFSSSYNAFEFASNNHFEGTEIVLRIGYPIEDIVLVGPKSHK